MSDRLPPLTALRAFDAAARHMSFAKAAEELHVTPAALSFQIKALETALGQPVFKRLNRAVELIAQKAASRGGRSTAQPLREMGEHPDGGAINVMEGRYGPYVTDGKRNGRIPKDREPETLTLTECEEIIAAAPARKKRGKKRATKKKAKTA